MTIRVLFLLVLLLAFSEETSAQTAELELAMSFDGIGDGVITGQRREFELTVTNNGPDAANPIDDLFFFVGSTVVSSNDLWVPDVFFELDGINSPPECFLTIGFGDPLPGQNPNYAFTFFFFQLQAGESITCRGFYTVNFTEGVRTVNWIMYNQLATDPDLSNNEVMVAFGLRPVSVPVNASWGLLLLSVLIGLLAIGIIQRQQAGLDKTSASKT